MVVSSHKNKDVSYDKESDREKDGLQNGNSPF